MTRRKQEMEDEMEVAAVANEEPVAPEILAAWAVMVPPSGVEPELREEPDFESGASTNSAKGAL